MPVLAGYGAYKDVTKICSLCGACNDVCPVKIPLYEFILEHRRIIVEDKKLAGWMEDAVYSQYGRVIGNSASYASAARLARLANHAPRIGPLKEWAKVREIPEMPKERFRDWFAKRRNEECES